MSLDLIPRSAYNEDHEAFRHTVRRFLQEEIEPNGAKWAEDGIVPKSIWPKAGELGMLCPTVPEEYGGLGLDFGYNAIVDEESAYYGRVTTGFSLQSDIVGVSIVLVEGDREGFQRGRNLDKIGQDEADTSELFFNDVRVPITNCLGEEGKGFIYLMSELPQERLSIAISAQASAQRAFDDTVAFTRDRKAFGKPVIDFQNTRFTLADLKTKLQVGWAHLDWALARHLKRELTPEEGAAAKLWHTELQWEVMDKCLQLHGGAGYMNEYAIARAWRGARVTRIFGGTNEIMKELIGRKL
eukprot:gene1652-1682_t